MRSPDEQITLLTARAVDILPKGGLIELLKQNRPLRVKLGFDPTKPDLHLGHAVVLNQLRLFQQLGHQVVVIIGDFTAQIGDPTGKDVTRPPLTPQEVEINAQTYLAQLGLVIDLDPQDPDILKPEIRRNSEWLDAMSLKDTIRLIGPFTVAQMLDRENFQLRFQKNEPIALHELLYPLMQAYDSVAIRADVELGGTDQTFNLLMGREMQPLHGQKPQAIMTLPLLVGLDGHQKMSKSLDNYVGLTDPADHMFGKIMSIPDDLMPNYWRLVSDLGPQDVEKVLAGLAGGQLHPRDAKMALARNVVKQYHGEAAAQAAQDTFITTFQKREIPSDIPERGVPAQTYKAFELVFEAQLASSKGEARRLIEGGGVRLDGEKIDDPNASITIDDGKRILQVGRRKFVALTGR